MEWLVSQLSLVTKVQDPIFAKLRPYAELHDENRTVYKYYKYHDGEVSALIRYLTNYGSSITVSMKIEKDGTTKFRMYDDRNELGEPNVEFIRNYIKEHDSCPEDKKWYKFVPYVSVKRRLHELNRYEYNKPDPYYKYYYDILSPMKNCFTMNFEEPSTQVYGHSETEENYFEKGTNKEYHFELSGLEAWTYWTWTDEKFNPDKLDENILNEEFKVLNETIKNWLKYDYNHIRDITLVPYTTFKLGAQINCIWDLTKFKDKSYEDMMELTTTLMLHFRNWIDKFWDNEIVKVFAKACNFDSSKPWEQNFSIDCAPGQVRPGEYFKHICEHILNVPYYEPISTFFGCWTWKVTFQNEKQRDDAYEYLAGLAKINAIR